MYSKSDFSHQNALRRVFALGIFPFAWLVGIVILSADKVAWSWLIACIFGVASYAAGGFVSKSAFFIYRRSTLISTIVVMAVLISSPVLIAIDQSATANPIGDASEYNHFWLCGRAGNVIPNHTGLVASVRRVDCAIWLAPSEIDYFVFVHKFGEPDDKGNLVFRYSRSDEDEPIDIAPSVSWSSDSSLRIAMGTKPRTTMRQTQISGVNIRYDLGMSSDAGANR